MRVQGICDAGELKKCDLPSLYPHRLPTPNYAIPIFNLPVHAVPNPNSLSFIIVLTLNVSCIILSYLYVVIDVLCDPLYQYHYFIITNHHTTRAFSIILATTLSYATSCSLISLERNFCGLREVAAHCQQRPSEGSHQIKIFAVSFWRTRTVFRTT